MVSKKDRVRNSMQTNFGSLIGHNISLSSFCDGAFS